MKNHLRPLTSRILIALAILSIILLPIGVQAGVPGFGRDPVWNAALEDVPAWLEMVREPNQLYSQYDLPVLAGKLIHSGEVNASDCFDSGMVADGQADECGLQRAENEMFAWQNQFNQAIIKSSRQSGVPPRLLKNIFAWESQFWPQTTYVNTFEYGLGHITEMGADSTLRWNVPFYDSICADSFSADTCKTDYADQPLSIRRALMGVVIQRVNADCPDCAYMLDTRLAERSVSIFSETLLANASYVKMIVRERTHRKAAEIISYEDLWKFTLVSYNAGPGCFLHAFSNLADAHNPYDWEHLIEQLEPGCQGVIPYVNFISQADDYHPENDPALLPTAVPVVVPPTSEKDPSTTETPVISVTVTVPFTPTLATPSASPVISATQVVSLTLTPADGTVFPLPTETPTPQEVSPTSANGTPTLADVTPEPIEATPTPYPLEYTPSPTVTLAISVTATPTVTLATPIPTTPAPLPVISEGPLVPDEIVVKINPRNYDLALQTLQGLGIDTSKDIRSLNQLETIIIQVSPGAYVAVLGTLQNSPYFEYAEPNYLVETDGLTSDPELPLQDNLTAVQVPQTWQALPSMQEVLVAVVDSGIDASHADLVDRIWQNAGEVGSDGNGVDRRSNGLDDDGNGYVDDWQGWNMLAGNNDISDTLGHGSHLAGIIGSAVDNSIGIAGIAPNARLLPIKVVDDLGYAAYTQVAEAILYATDMGARIINLGLSGTAYSELLADAVEYAVKRNVLVIASSGNNGQYTPNYPAGYPEVLAVSAVDNSGYWAPFSGSGEHISLAAPGMDVYSTGPGGSYYTASGTSQAAAHVSGIAVLLAGQPEFADSSFLRAALLKSAQDRGDPDRDPFFGYGLVQAYDALKIGQPVVKIPSPRLPPTPPSTNPVTPSNLPEEELWGRSQVVWGTLTNPANSLDGAFNDLTAASTGAYGGSSARSWTFTAIDDTTRSNVAAVYLDIRFYLENWVNDAYRLQVYEPGNPACALGWCTVMTLRLGPTQPGEVLPPTVLTTLSIPVTQYLDTPAKINNTQIRLSGYITVGGSAEVITINIDAVRLRVLDVLPPTPTPTPTPIFMPTATLPGSRAATAIPSSDEPHSNFSPDIDQCASCHRSHTAQGSSLGSEQQEEQVCFSCHTAGGSGTNVQPAFTSKTNTLTRFFSHPVSDTEGIHNAGELVGGEFGGANRHIECEDCHSPHASARSAVPGSNPAPAVQQEVFQSTGVDPLWTAIGAPTDFTWMTVADREYQVCLKCHSSYSPLSSYSPDGYGWGVNASSSGYIADGLSKLTTNHPAQVRDNRDLAIEFNSYQASFHPVTAQGRNANMPAGSFVAPWSQDSIVYCTDCHDNGDNSTNGPHGSPLLHILDGSAEYITEVDPARSCAPGGCPTIHNPGELCFKCHQFNTYSNGINPASTTMFRNGNQNLHEFHTFSACYTCHDLHGSEQDHLINFDTSVVFVYPGYNSQTAWQFNPVTNTGTCYVACHDGDHGSLTPYSP